MKEGIELNLKDLKILTFLIFTFTMLYFYVLALLEQLYLGFIMIIPLITLLIYHYATRKKIKLKQFIIKKPKMAPLLLSIIIPIVLGLLVHLFFFTINQGHFLFENPIKLLFLVLIGLTASTGSALLEEIVWRGFYHNSLRKIYTFKKTAIIVAVIWSIWHLPIALFYKEYTNLFIGTLSYLLILFFTSCLLSYLREWSDSVLPAAFFHGLMNVFYFSDGIHILLSKHMTDLIKFLIFSLVLITTLLLGKIHKTIKK